MKVKKNIGEEGVSLSAVLQKPTGEYRPPETTTKLTFHHEPDKPFKPEQMLEKWNDYANRIVQDDYLKSTMLACQPHDLTENSFTVTFTSRMQHQLILKNKAEIVAFMRVSLQNKTIDFEPLLEISPEPEEKLMTNRERFELFLKENPNLGLLYEELGLELL
jgi:hypothetical protein